YAIELLITDEGEVIMRMLAIALAAAAAITAGSAVSASAKGMGMGMGMGHMGHVGSFHPAFHNQSAFRHFEFGHHRFFRHGRFFAFAPDAYGYDDCRIWTPYGWRWSYACYAY